MILAVDGSATALFSLVMLLGRLEYRVLKARSGSDALKLLQSSTVAVVITDGALPDMDGAGFLKAMKDSPRCSQIPVIVLLARSDAALEAACARLGCAACLPKSVDPDELYRRIQSLSEAAPRQHIRLATSIRITVGDGTALGGPERNEQATALSEGGLFVQTRYPQPKNAVTPLRMTIEGREIRAKALVLYSSAQGMGMKFIDLSGVDRDLIREFINKQLVQGIHQ